jgi:dTDP-4-dehydrorhamnose reductase
MTGILVTGANGQLGSCFKKLESKYPDLNFTFLDSKELDISNEGQVSKVFFGDTQFDFCLNCAAYTAVDQAELESEKAFLVNAQGALLIAKACNRAGVCLIHFSTDFVFDGNKKSPYLENDITNPLGVYGLSKLQGENNIKSQHDSYFIVRTSWLYSEFNKNFVKTMLTLSQEKTSLNIVDDQIGAPTYASDLAEATIKIVSSKSRSFGIYHYSNQGEISWFDFASKVFELAKVPMDLNPIKTHEYKTLAERPSYSVLDTQKIEAEFNLTIKKWDLSLKEALTKIT